MDYNVEVKYDILSIRDAIIDIAMPYVSVSIMARDYITVAKHGDDAQVMRLAKANGLNLDNYKISDQKVI